MKRRGMPTSSTPYDKIPRWMQFFLQAVILYSVITCCLETMPELARYEPFFQASEKVVVAIFTIEYLAMWALSDQKLRYPFRPMAVIDLLAIAPFYIGLGSQWRMLRSIRLMRLFRILKLGKYSRSMQLLGVAMNRAAPEFAAFGFVAVVAMLISATAIYYAEHDAQPEVFSSIPKSLWWAVVTLTTVGYGDAYPVTAVGRVIAGMVMFLGIGFVAVPAGIISSTLTDLLREERKKQRASHRHRSLDSEPAADRPPS